MIKATACRSFLPAPWPSALVFSTMLALALFWSNSSQAQRATLACTGVATLPDQKVYNAPFEVGLTVDLRTKTVSGFPGGDYSITEQSEQEISFSQTLIVEGAVTFVKGTMNRITGDTTVIGTKAVTPNIATIYFRLSCKPSKRLF